MQEEETSALALGFVEERFIWCRYCGRRRLATRYSCASLPQLAAAGHSAAPPVRVTDAGAAVRVDRDVRALVSSYVPCSSCL